MASWRLGIDEAGYGPNLGPFVMTAVACRLPDEHASADLWDLLKEAVRKTGKVRDERLVVDDSKEVFKNTRGLSGLERGLASLTRLPGDLKSLIEAVCHPEGGELAREHWYTGTTALPAATPTDELETVGERFRSVCLRTEVGSWRVQSVIVCPRRFNAITEEAGSKSAVLGEGFIRLLRWAYDNTDKEESLTVDIDKQGGRNTYAAQIQQALPEGLVAAQEERAERSVYRVLGLSRELRLTFQPRADASAFCVALASMVSKYLRELLMGEFNQFWQRHVPGLAATAGYPGDAPRFFAAIRARAKSLEIPEDSIWRRR